MMRLLIRLFFLLSITADLYGGVLINEISAGGSDDWVEIRVTEDTPSIDISQFFVTMYYGTNEKISESPVTLRGRDIPETPFDDRFAVIHFTSGGKEDETDAAGDINKNRVRDLYCNNYGLWNTDCVVAIDSDDNPKNGGILDFAAFSNRDGSPNSTITGYMKSAAESGAWILCTCENLQECMTFTGPDGLNSYSTLARKNSPDSNSPDDFVVTPYASPGMDNIFESGGKVRKISSPVSDRITLRTGTGNDEIPVKLFIYEPCSVKIRIFSSAGLQIYASDIVTADPGYFTMNIDSKKLRGRRLTGLYPVRIESFASGRSADFTIFLVVINGR